MSQIPRTRPPPGARRSITSPSDLFNQVVVRNSTRPLSTNAITAQQLAAAINEAGGRPADTPLYPGSSASPSVSTSPSPGPSPRRTLEGSNGSSVAILLSSTSNNLNEKKLSKKEAKEAKKKEKEEKKERKKKEKERAKELKRREKEKKKRLSLQVKALKKGNCVMCVRKKVVVPLPC